MANEIMLQNITIKLRLCDKHSAELNRQARAVNFVWNYLNQTSKTAWARDHRWLSGFDLGRLTSGSSKYLDLHAHTIKRVCDQFAISRDKAKRAGIRWRGQKSLGWIPFNTGHVVFDGSSFKFRGIFYKTMHLNALLIEKCKIGAGSFNQDSRGRWYLNAPIKVKCDVISNDKAVGIDLGLRDFATLSNGEKVEAPNFYRDGEEKLAAAQRAKKSSKQIRNIHVKIANRRKDFLHKVSTSITRKYGTIIIGDVSAKKLAKTRLAKSVYDAGWSSFRNMLSYKANRHGAVFMEVSERMSSQVCSECGSMPTSRPKGIADLAIREWICSDCGASHDRDVNAAQNILRLGQQTLAEGALA